MKKKNENLHRSLKGVKGLCSARSVDKCTWKDDSGKYTDEKKIIVSFNLCTIFPGI